MICLNEINMILMQPQVSFWFHLNCFSFRAIIENIKPIGVDSKIEEIIQTKNGVHLITKKFDILEFNKKMEVGNKTIPDIQKKNPTLLYYPESLG